MTQASYRTLRAPLRHEIEKIKGSRFLASLAPVATVTEAQDFLAARRAEFRDATHNCFAWRLGAHEERSSDDGEPAGTAGRPMLQEIDARQLQQTIVVVTRYYGGTNLGKGGLVRAYAQAAGAALDLADVVEVPILETLRLEHAYDLTGPVMSVLSAFRLAPKDAVYGQAVQLAVAVPVDRLEALRQALVEATADGVRFVD